MADHFLHDPAADGLHAHDWLKLAGLFALFSVLMLAVMCLTVRLATPT